MKAIVGTFNQEKALVGAFSMIVKTGCATDGSFYSTSNYILISSEYLNLKASQISVNMKYSNSFSTSSVTSGPLLEKSPCLVTDTNVVVSNETASSVSVFLKMM